MSRAGAGGRMKKHNCCLTCAIINFVVLIVFFAALYVGGLIMFKTYVSPHIGGLGLNDAIALAANVLSGKNTDPNYTEEDLDSFYSELSEAMFLSDKSTEELQYELVSEEKRATLAPASAVAASEDGEETVDPAYAAFLLKSPSERYALLSSDVTAKISLAEFSSLGGTSEAAVAARKKVGLKTYRLSIEKLLGDMDFGAEDFSLDGALEKSLSSLEFNFDVLKDYDVDNEGAAINEKFTTFSVRGPQVSAFINDLMTALLASKDSPLTESLKDTIPENLDMTQFVNVASVTIMNTPVATKNGEAAFDQKDTALSMSIVLKLRDMVKAALELDDIKSSLDGVPSFVINLIPKLVPKFFSLHATVYPLAVEGDHREVVLMFNKKSDKNAECLSILLNALLSDEGKDSSATFLEGINNEIVKTFGSINEKVKINFVPSKDKDGNTLKDENGNAYSEMKIMTWQTVLSLLDDGGRLSPHDVFTMLKCLYVSTDRPAELALDAKMDAFKAEMSSKYGVKKTYLDENNLLSADDLGGMIENIDLKTVNYAEADYDKMRVDLSAEALASFMKNMLSEDKSETSAGVAAAEEDSDLLKSINPKICGIEIKKISEKDGVAIFSFELIFSTDLSKMLKDKLPDEGVSGSLSRKILPKQDTYFGVLLYLSEYTDEEGKLLHKVGKAIDDPQEGVESKYLSKLRINDFSYDAMDRVYDAMNNFMEVVAKTDFKITDIIDKVEETISEVFDNLANNDFKLDMRLYEAGKDSRGGINLPSIYELIASLVEPKLDQEKEETFTKEDAKDVLLLMYEKVVSLEKAFADEQGDVFIDEINDKYYLKKDSALSAADLFGEKASEKTEGSEEPEESESSEKSLAGSISASSIYFKPTDTEAAAWVAEKGEGYVKKALYTDTRSSTDLRVKLSGSSLAALVKNSGLLPEDMIASFGEMEVLGAKFDTKDKKTYLIFDMKLLFNKEEGDEGDSIKYGSLVPEAIKLTATVLLYAEEYAEDEPQYAASVKINEDNATKIFLLMRALGSDDLSKEKIEEKISNSISDAFEKLKDIPLYYYDSTSGKPYTVDNKEDGEQCLLLSDVFSFLIKETEMKDNADTDTDPDNLAIRLRKFGEQAQDIQNWMGDILKPFDDADDDYIYRNMELAYFLKTDEEHPLDMDSIYGEGNSAFTDKFKTIKEDNFRLSGNDGLYLYDGNILSLKVSDRALGVIVKAKQADDFKSAVTGEGMTVDFVSLKLYHEGGNLVLESGVKVLFDDRKDYEMMPDYFYAIAKTVRSRNEESGEYEFNTTITLNTANVEMTEKLFTNIGALKNKGMDATTFDKSKIETTINDAIAKALSKFPETAVFKEFTAEELSAEYSSGYEKEEGGSLALPEAEDGYIGFPSVYSYLIDFFYTAEDTRPQETDMQHMLNKLHAGDDAVKADIVTNEKNAYAYHSDIESLPVPVYKGSTVDTAAFILSDRYLAYKIDSLFSTVSLQDGKLSLKNALQQIIVLGNLGDKSIAGEWSTWKDKFYEFGSYATGDHYLIATASLSLASYNTGNKANLLPENLWFTVLADVDTTASSKGLLYDMNHAEKDIFEHILKKSGQESETPFTFDIDTIAKEFADKINTALVSLSGGISGFPGLNVEYRLASDDDEDGYIVYEDYNDSESIINVTDEIQAPLAEDEQGRPNGKGYIVLSKSE